MADADLDDFFAKKDKSKKKNKSTFTTSEILAKQKKATRSGEKRKKEKEKSQQSQSSGGSKKEGAEEDKEWNDYVEEEEADYSGLRIQNLQISKEDGEQQEEEEEDDDEDGCGEGSEKKKAGVQGPWNVQQAAVQPPPPQPVEKAPVAEKEPVKEEPKTGKYVPPSMRARQDELKPMVLGGGGSHHRKKRTAPNLHSEEDFPTLGGGPADADYDRTRFETVRGGGRQSDDHLRRGGERMEITNKFDALNQE